MSFSFGAPSSAPATSSFSGGFSFGANKPATTAAQPSSGLFGTPTSTAPSFGNTSFGTSTTPGFGATSAAPAFGATTTPAFGSSAGTSAFGASTGTPAFGTTSVAPTFGATSTAPAFGATSTAPAFGTATPAFGAGSTTFGTGTGLGTSGLNFGAGTGTSTGLSFGTPATATTTATGLGGLGGFGFGGTTTQSTGFGLFGGTSTASTTNSLFAMFPSFTPPGTPQIPVTQTFQMLPTSQCNPTPKYSISPLAQMFCTQPCNPMPSYPRSPVSQMLPTSQCNPGSSYPISPTMHMVPTHQCNPTPNCPIRSIIQTPHMYNVKYPAYDGYHIISPTLGAKLSTTNVTGSQPSTLVTPSLGLGGVSTATGVATTTSAADGKSEPPKQTKLPNELITTVETFKEFVKKQKSLSSDIMRISIKPLHKVSAEAEECLRGVLRLSGEVSRARAHSRRLRGLAAAALHAADRPPSSELEGAALPSYVKELISELEQQLITFRRQMDVADKQMQASPKLLTEQELTLGIRRMHESLVALAGRLQAVHTQVEAQKEQYLNLRKYVLKDPTNVFETPTATSNLDQIIREAEASRKRNKTSFYDTKINSIVLSDPKAALGSVNQLAGPTPFSYMGSTMSPYPAIDSSGPSWQPQQPSINSSLNTNPFGTTAAAVTNTSTFQLQRPPGKRTKQ